MVDGALSDKTKIMLVEFLRVEDKRDILRRMKNGRITSEELLYLKEKRERDQDGVSESPINAAKIVDDDFDLEEALGEALISLCILRHESISNLSKAKSQLVVWQNHIQEVETNQSRLRENIKAMQRVSSLKLINRYLADLDKEEDELIKIRRDITMLNQKITAIESKRLDIDKLIRLQVDRLLADCS